jgi:phosphate transport system substrate-binding protein
MGRGRWIIFFLLLTACAPATPRALVRLNLVGSDSMHALAQALTDAYTHQRPEVTFTIQTANSNAGLRAANEISGTIGMVARALKPNELIGTRAIVIARDGIAVIVNRANPINAIMRSQIAEIFSGQILAWPLGSIAGQPILVISREEGSGTRDAFEQIVMNGQRVTRAAILLPNEAAVVDYVAQNPNAIGYCSMGALTSQVTALSIDDVPLTPQTVEAKKYPLVRAFAFIAPTTPSPATQEFFAFVLGTEGQKIVTQKFGRAQ